MEPILLGYTPPQILFLVLSIGMILCSVLMVHSRHPVYSALFMIATMFGVAACFILLDSFFLGVIQVLVYAGAIMVLFLFIIMLLNVDQEATYQPSLGLVGIFLSAAFAGDLWAIIWQDAPGLPDPNLLLSTPAKFDVHNLAMTLFDKDVGYWFAFEAVSMLLLSAILGVVVLSKRRLE